MNTKAEDKLSFHKFTHEIKNPLSVCNGYLEILYNKENKIKKEYLKIIKKEIKRTLSIINDYVENKSITNLNIEEIDLSYLLEDVVEILNDLYKENNSKIIFIDDNEYYIKGDYNKLKQVFINILKNSLEAKTNNKLLTVIKLIELKESIKIIITDNGIGMNKESLNNIGKEFFTTKEKGTGLGVPFIKDIIKLHNGTVEYKSKENIGTKVIITLNKS